jgi:hypothetical protein
MDDEIEYGQFFAGNMISMGIVLFESNGIPLLHLKFLIAHSNYQRT